ncbi:MAG TPA: hypothetical protein DCZ94_19710 [Lentisphaeria bacterium]|nr:hypothetical protein [Lentisphaeria bacterium]
MTFAVCAIFTAVTGNIILGIFFRPLWFDEALTLMDFVMRPDLLDIYRQYNIPNDHIVYNILLRLWIEGCNAVPFLAKISLRSFTVATAFASLALLIFFWKRRFKPETVFTACLCLILSLPFTIYATAVRGYMLSFLLILVALEAALLYKEKGRPAMLILFFFLSFLACGVIPTNIIAFAAIYLFLLPSLKPKEIFSDRTILLAIIPVASLLLFYIPIFGKFMKVLSLKEGWSGGIDASIHFYSAFIISFLPLIILTVLGKFSAKDKSAPLKNMITLLIFLIPLIIFMLKSPSPFPRAFFCLWPVWLFILCSYADSAIPLLREKYPGPFLPSLLCVCLLWAALPLNFPVQLSNALSKGGQDDFFKPYFMRSDFRPIETVKKCVEISGSSKVGRRVFLDFAADYPSIFFYGRVMGINDSFWVFDKPGRRVETLGDDEKILVITRDDEGMVSISKRFNMKSFELVEDCGFQKIYEAKLR